MKVPEDFNLEKVSPRNWTCSKGTYGWTIYDATGQAIGRFWADDTTTDNRTPNETNPYTVHCVNNHEPLVKALEEALNLLKPIQAKYIIKDGIPDENVFDLEGFKRTLAAAKLEK